MPVLTDRRTYCRESDLGVFIICGRVSAVLIQRDVSTVLMARQDKTEAKHTYTHHTSVKQGKRGRRKRHTLLDKPDT